MIHPCDGRTDGRTAIAYSTLSIMLYAVVL